MKCSGMQLMVHLQFEFTKLNVMKVKLIFAFITDDLY